MGMVKLTWLLLTGGLVVSWVVPARSEEPGMDGVTVVRSDDRGVILEFRPTYVPDRIIHTENGDATLIDFRGSVTPASDTVGSPDLRASFLPLGFPAQEGNAVQVIASDYQEISGVLFAPVPTPGIRGDFAEPVAYTPSSSRYAHSAFLPGAVAELSSVGFSRSMILGAVRVNPVQYNPATRTVRKYSRIVVEVVFGTPMSPRVQNTDDLIYRHALLNYGTARNWKFGHMASSPASLHRSVSSVLAAGDWYRLAITAEGVYRLDASFFASIGVNTASLDPRTIRIYGNGGAELSENPLVARPSDLVENAIYVAGESDGQFNASDYVLFYGRSTRGWTYDATRKAFRHYIHHYTETNYYWLTFGAGQGKRMNVLQQPQNPTVFPDRFTDRVAVEEERVNPIKSGKQWYGQTVGPNGSFSHVNTLPGLVPGDVIRYRYALAVRSESASPFPNFTVRENGTLLGSHGFATGFVTSGEFAATGTSSLTGNMSQVSFAFTGNSGASGWIDWLEINYPRSFTLTDNGLRFRSPDTTGVVEYRLATFSAPSFVFDVSAYDSVLLISAEASNSFVFRDFATAGTVREYYAVGPGSFKTPASVQKIVNQDLHGISDGADFIIVTNQEYRSAADRLRQFREQPGHGNLKSVVVDVDQIYNEFGGGLPDISAIRDFLKYTYNTWTLRPSIVLFLGQASYDYKGILGAVSSKVPTWQSLVSTDDISSYASDDFFVEFENSNRPFMATGRISARTAAEASAFVEKLVGYETSSSHDGWTARMLFVGDDGFNPEDPNPWSEGTRHSAQAEMLATTFTPDEFDKIKVYIAEYPTVQTPVGRRKPAAFQAIIDAINRGVLVVNYTGHGNPAVWAHENVFNVQTSIPQLTNATRLPVLYAATCNFSQFDDPQRYTGGELLLNRAEGGAIGVVSAARAVYSDQNSTLHQQNFRYMFTRDSHGRLVIERPATAMFIFKSVFGNSVNDQKYLYLGDPSMHLLFPAGFASFDEINGEAVDSVDGQQRTSLIQLNALSRITINGTIRNAANAIDTTANGEALISANDASTPVTIVDFTPGTSWTYQGRGGTIYRGGCTIRNGRFSASFVVPKDITYADSLSRSRMAAYGFGGGTDWLAHTTNIRFGGTDTSVTDQTGPGIRVFLGNRNFQAGDLVSEQPHLIVDLTDSNGINTSTAGIGHRIEAWVNNSPQSIDITDYYRGSLDNYREGTVEYDLKNLSPGRNTIRIRAWDTFNNPTSAETFFEVGNGNQLTVTDVMNYPNPFAGGTSFTFRQNQNAPIAVTVRIYTLAGRLIQTIDAVSAGEPFVKIPWDGRDRDGDVLANGVYLYKILVRSQDGRFASNALGKLSVLK